jgi:hypothetical protein
MEGVVEYKFGWKDPRKMTLEELKEEWNKYSPDWNKIK